MMMTAIIPTDGPLFVVNGAVAVATTSASITDVTSMSTSAIIVTELQATALALSLN